MSQEVERTRLPQLGGGRHLAGCPYCRFGLADVLFDTKQRLIEWHCDWCRTAGVMQWVPLRDDGQADVPPDSLLRLTL